MICICLFCFSTFSFIDFVYSSAYYYLSILFFKNKIDKSYNLILQFNFSFILFFLCVIYLCSLIKVNFFSSFFVPSGVLGCTFSSDQNLWLYLTFVLSEICILKYTFPSKTCFNSAPQILTRSVSDIIPLKVFWKIFSDFFYSKYFLLICYLIFKHVRSFAVPFRHHFYCMLGHSLPLRQMVLSKFPPLTAHV